MTILSGRNISPISLSYFGKEFGLALVICSYYLSGIAASHFGRQAEIFVSIIPLIYGCLMFFRFLLYRIKLSKGGGQVLLFSTLVLFATFSEVFKGNAPDQLLSYALRFLYSGVFLAIVAWVTASDKSFEVEKFYQFFCFIISFLVIYAFFWGDPSGGRLSIIGRNPIYFSLLCAFSFLVSFFYLSSLSRFSLLGRLIFLFFLLVSFSGLILSGGRGALLSMAVTLLFYGVCCFISILFSGVIKRQMNFLFLLFLAVMGALATFYFFDSRAIKGLVYLFSGDFGASGNERINIFSQWLAIYEKDPLLGGGFPSNLGYPHNILLELLFRHGVLGLIAAFFLLYLVLKYSVRGFLSGFTKYKVLSALVFCSFFSGMFSFSIVMKSDLFIFIVFSSVLIPKLRGFRMMGRYNP